MALLFHDRGSASICGLDCWRQSVDVKRVVGYLPGELALDPNLTGGQILAYFANLRGGVDQIYLTGLISRLDLDISRRFRHYSHGNKQKVGLIQAFMHARTVDPTANDGLDPTSRDRMAPRPGRRRPSSCLHILGGGGCATNHPGGAAASGGVAGMKASRQRISPLHDTARRRVQRAPGVSVSRCYPTGARCD